MSSDSYDLKENQLGFSFMPSKGVDNEDLSELGLEQGGNLLVKCTNCSNHSFHRDRKSWSEEEKKEHWRQKRLEKRKKKSMAAASRKAAQKAEWEKLSEYERNEQRASAIKYHEEQRRANELFMEATRQRLADPGLPVLVFDLSFAWCMTLTDTKSTISQLMFSYSTLRRAGFPFRPVFSSLIGKERQDAEHDSSEQAGLLQASLIDFKGFKRFPPTITLGQHWSELFHKDKIVFLTADADEVLDDIQAGHTYIIGAFVDHNRYKALSKTRAEAHGVRVARLPVKESIDLHNRSAVLTINHLVEVLTSYVQPEEGCVRDWARAFNAALPIRRIRQEVLGSRKRRRQQRKVTTASEGSEGLADLEGSSLNQSS